MNDNSLQHVGIDDLMSQDHAVTSFAYDEFRKQLEASIQRLEHRARVIRLASHWSLGALITCILCTLPLEMFGLFAKYEWVRPVWSGCGVVVMLITAVLAGIYQYRYQPALNRAKSDLQAALFAQLQQQIADLGRRLDRRA